MNMNLNEVISNYANSRVFGGVVGIKFLIYLNDYVNKL